MRVTNQSLLNNYLRNLNRNLNGMSIYQNQLSSGKEIGKPSDDPFKVTRAMSLHTSINQNGQYLRNIEDSIGWVDMTDSSLGGLGDILNRMRELVVKGANAHLSESDRKAIQDEADQLIGQVSQIGNTNYDGRYIFAGQNTTKPPFDIEDGLLVYNPDIDNAGDDYNDILKREISQNVIIEINIPGSWIIQGKNNTLEGEKDLPNTLRDISKAIEEGDLEKLGEDLLIQLDDHIENLLSLRSEAGAKYNRLDAAKEKNKDETLNMKELLSNTEDIDIAEKAMMYFMMENVYKASLATGGRIMQPSLLDFLR